MKTKIEIENNEPDLLLNSLKDNFTDSDKVQIMFKTRHDHKSNINLLVVNIISSDLTSMKATINSLMRLVVMIEKMGMIG